MPIGRQVKIVSITGASSSGSATEINSGHPWIVATVGYGGNPTYCRLPSGAEVGDVVEVYGEDASGLQILILPPASESFLASDAAPRVVKYGGALFRKISATKWVYILSDLTPQ